MIDTKKFQELLKRAAGHNTLNRFLDNCNVDPLYIQKIMLGFEANIPNDNILKRMVKGSNGKITYDELARVFQEEKIKKNFNANVKIKRMQLWWIDLGEGRGCEQGGIRPCIIVTNPKGLEYSEAVTEAPTTTQIKKSNLPTHVIIDQECGLEEKSMILMEQVRTVDKSRLIDYIGECTDEYKIAEIEKAYKITGGVVDIEDEIKRTVNRINDEELKSSFSIFENMKRSLMNLCKEKRFAAIR